MSLVILALLAYVFDMRGTLLASLAMLLFLALYHYIHREDDNATNAHRAEEKTEHLSWVLKAARAHGRITNHEVQMLLKISHSTAERYLEELESHGELEQIGDTGRSVSYRIKKSHRTRFLVIYS